MGHELSGTVVACGADVADLSVGDRITADPNVVDDVCYFCRHGVDHLCSGLTPLGVAQAGGFRRARGVPARYAYILPEGISLDIGSQIEPIACCVHGIDRAAIVAGDLVTVLGSGPIGCILIQLARMQGAGTIVAVEPSPSRRKLAALSGADVVCDPSELAGTLQRVRATAGTRRRDRGVRQSGRRRDRGRRRAPWRHRVCCSPSTRSPRASRSARSASTRTSSASSAR